MFLLFLSGCQNNSSGWGGESLKIYCPKNSHNEGLLVDDISKCKD